jgi:hypothetical protein
VSALVRFSMLLSCCGLLAGCGGSGTDQYQTFQPETKSPEVSAVAQPVPPVTSAAPVPEAVAGTQQPSPFTVTEPAVTAPQSAATTPNAGAAAGAVAPVAAEAVQPVAGGQAVAGDGVAGEGADAVVSGAEVISAQSGLSGPADRPAIDNGAAGEVRQIQLLVPQKRFRRERPSEAVRVSYDDIDLLKVLNMEPVPAHAVEHFPEWLKSLDGKLVRIRGFMYPTYVATGLTEFALARDNGICCFVRQPKIYDIMTVQLAEGETTDYIANRPFDVEGIFRIDPDADQPQLSRLYRIEQAKVLQ